MNSYNIKYNTKNVKEIRSHLERCDTMFVPKLSLRVDIGEYADKIVKNASTVELWETNKMVGLIATYFNDPNNEKSYITNVSLEKEIQGKGMAFKLMVDMLQKAKELKYTEISLNVDVNNINAVKLYQKFNFKEISRDKNFIEMIHHL